MDQYVVIMVEKTVVIYTKNVKSGVIIIYMIIIHIRRKGTRIGLLGK